MVAHGVDVGRERGIKSFWVEGRTFLANNFQCILVNGTNLPKEILAILLIFFPNLIMAG